MRIINQDRDRELFYFGDEMMMTMPDIEEGKIHGFRLMIYPSEYEAIILGYFNTLLEAIYEMEQIQSCQDTIYLVNGYCNYDGTEDFMDIIAKLEEEEEFE